MLLTMSAMTFYDEHRRIPSLIITQFSFSLFSSSLCVTGRRRWADFHSFDPLSVHIISGLQYIED